MSEQEETKKTPRRAAPKKEKETREQILARAVQFADGPALSMNDSAAYLKRSRQAMPAIIERFKLKRRGKGLGREVYLLVADLDNIANTEYVIDDTKKDGDDTA